MPGETSSLPENLPAVPGSGPRPAIGMHGERIDWLNPRSQLYHLGDGARSYDPMLQCFLNKDPYCPFSGGGINPYAFCRGDPVNRSDHSGYMSVSAGFGLGMGILGILLGILTLGLATLAAMTVLGSLLLATSTVLGLASSATGIASAVLEDRDPELARTLGWISLGLGMASAVTGMIGPALASYVKATGRVITGRLIKNGHINFVEATESQDKIHFLFLPEFKDGSLVMTHGKPGLMQTINGTYVTPDEWADELFRFSGYARSRPGSPLYLMSCNAATPHAPAAANAQYIADVLGRTTRALNSPVSMCHIDRLPRLLPRTFVGRGNTWGKLLDFTPQ
ncbi:MULTISPECIES: RHS repeat-associated core domain-containing protein [Microvirgula]|uniref:RHS repeat-associated core domain-containing protein n=1 Tax=Microvirgula aerodenitrificans TaxID=57480 RepID=A0A2S0P6M7_9NEIS|nr:MULTISPECIES: RHS repeat-associated core domain-containing protein [Microvirgula]AVY93048.1 hypothetical protein DAI18_02535 [Microvirgula aerodenitrificans]RAS12938.1 RHS repeat-associated protein [Microvirgula sp. AG722]